MKRLKLKVEKREIMGKQLKKLRKSGILPGNIYGKEIKSQAVQVAYKDFTPIYDEVKETGLLDVDVAGNVVPVLIKNVQLDAITRQALHADFFQVNLKEKVKSMVPLELTGEAKAVTDNIGLLMPLLSEIEVEALPEDLPEKVEVNVEHLAAVNEQVTVEDLKIPTDVEVLTDKGQVVVKVAELVSRETQEQMAEEKAAAEAAKTEGAENETAEAKPETGEKTENEGKVEEKSESESKEEKPEK